MSPAGRRFLLQGGDAPSGPPREGEEAPVSSRAHGAVAPRRLTMLTHGWCHLCDDMRAALVPLAAAHALDLVEIDIDADTALDAAYGERVPVLFAGDVANGREICHGRLDRGALMVALAGEHKIR